MASLNFKKFGEGEPIIVLHGLYGSSDNWVSIARALMSDFGVYLLDIRNHGASPHLNEHNYNVLVDDLMEFMNEQNIYSAIILGHSMGGKVAMHFAAMYPERVKKMIVVDISPRTYKPSEGDAQFNEHSIILNALNGLNLSALNDRNEAEDALRVKIPSERVLQFLLKNLRRSKNKEFFWKINIAVLLNNINNILVGVEDFEDELKQFKSPTLFIKGGLSDYIKDIDKALIAKLFVNAIIVEISNTGHWVHAEKSDEFVDAVRQFLLA